MRCFFNITFEYLCCFQKSEEKEEQVTQAANTEEQKAKRQKVENVLHRSEANQRAINLSEQRISDENIPIIPIIVQQDENAITTKQQDHNITIVTDQHHPNVFDITGEQDTIENDNNLMPLPGPSTAPVLSA